MIALKKILLRGEDLPLENLLLMAMHDHYRHMVGLALKDGRYSPDAFIFVSEAISHTGKWIREGSLPALDQEQRGVEGEFHVSGKELLAGFRRLAWDRWGQMAPCVLRGWGLCCTEDVGEIVFLMVEEPQLEWRKRECDSREDFAHGYDFDEVFSRWE